jgi:hypothetical protein
MGVWGLILETELEGIGPDGLAGGGGPGFCGFWGDFFAVGGLGGFIALKRTLIISVEKQGGKKRLIP